MSVLFASADRAPATYTKDFSIAPDKRGFLINLNKTAEGAGTSTLVVKVQYRDGTKEGWVDLQGAAFNATGFDGGATVELDLMVYPGIAAIANRAVSSGVPRTLRLSAVVGVANVTFSANLEELT